MKKLLPVAIPLMALLFSFCGQSEHTLKGTIANAANLQVTLDQVFFDRNNNIALGKTSCDAGGKFELKLEKPFEEGLYRLSIGAKRLFFILDGKEGVVDIAGDLNTIDRMEVSVKGSEAFKSYASVIQELIKTQLKSPEDARAAIKKGSTPLMRAFLMTQLLGQNAGQFIDDFKAQQQELDAAMPNTQYSKDFGNIITQLEKQLAAQKSGNDGTGVIQVGMTAPEISLPDPKGKVRSLSDLRGKVVLVDFWASWCGPCRRFSPHVVEMYKKYKAKGFEVFSVSLDRPGEKDKWVSAIQQDGLVWENHVSDLKYWNCEPAARYGVRAIPQTFLLDRKGVVVALNPRDNLEDAITKVL